MLPEPATEAGQVVRFLGLDPTVNDRVALASLVADGLPSGTVSYMRDHISADIFGKLLPPATLNRARNRTKPLTRETSEKLYEFSRTYVLALSIYRNDESKAAAFMQRPHPLLGGKTPMAVATSSSAGADAVRELLHRADAGFAA